MTSPWTPLNTQGSQDPSDYFDPMKQQGHLLILRIHAEAKGVVTKHCPDGWQRRPGKEPMINNALQVSVVDLNWQNPDGTLGKIYPEAMIHTGTLIGALKRSVGETKLLMWRQKPTPVDAYGNPDKTNPYDITDMSGDTAAVAAANNFLSSHPEFMQIPAPAPYQPPAPAPQSPPMPPPQPGYGQQGPPPGWGTQYPQVQPQQPGWQSPQGYPPAQPQGYPQPQPQWQPPAPQWTPPAPPQQAPAAWNTAAPPPGYYQQQGPPPPQQQPGNFYEAAAQMPPQQVPQAPAYNHHGQPQPVDPPY
jgi:hypothetical protein